MMRRTLIGGLALLALMGSENVAAATAPEATGALAVTRTRARVTDWVDGDTVETTRGTVRLIGMDTPERGGDCYRQATSNAARLAPVGSRITLVRVRGRDNTDRYGRKLRYVEASAVDVGYKQIVKGLADARYDSGGYGTHPQRAKYRAADAQYPDKTCQPAPPPPPPPPGCDPSYPDFCIPPPPPDLDCADIGTSFTVIGSDPHGFDADEDGTGCDSYG
jgi:endonuclease YncB( thermonuclease family)